MKNRYTLTPMLRAHAATASRGRTLILTISGFIVCRVRHGLSLRLWPELVIQYLHDRPRAGFRERGERQVCSIGRIGAGMPVRGVKIMRWVMLQAGVFLEQFGDEPRRSMPNRRPPAPARGAQRGHSYTSGGATAGGPGGLDGILDRLPQIGDLLR